jgi:hypothetical protein
MTGIHIWPRPETKPHEDQRLADAKFFARAGLEFLFERKLSLRFVLPPDATTLGYVEIHCTMKNPIEGWPKDWTVYIVHTSRLIPVFVTITPVGNGPKVSVVNRTVLIKSIEHVEYAMQINGETKMHFGMYLQ